MSNREVVIPVSAAFEKRLAELVWENAPELARQTAAGKLALSLDVDGKAVQRMVLDDLRPAITEWAQKQVPAVKEQVLAQVSTVHLVDEVADSIRAYIRQSIGKTDIANEAGKRLQAAVDRIMEAKLQPMLKEYFGDNDESFHKVVQSRIDAYLEKHLDVSETHAAIADATYKMASDS